ncbi:hypothetical protein AGOR_G00250570 [Albula goreensis]|uniref:SHSP domain-containing protein n=1 Tax=Albula goreensis TaxID=1534307 RepID=A0A8T3CI97_9TELE|nr:hypothetical protein AGOR_G00250570 [Albula goreensis]
MSPMSGLPPFLEPGDLSWIEWARRRLATSSWPGYMPPPIFTPAPMQTPLIPRYPRAEQAGGVSEIRTGPDSWRINLDVSCFSPREVTIRTRGGYLEISGNHEDRQDEYGFVSKCFSRKYNRLPAGADLRHIRSTLSPDGVLSVEAPLPAMANEIPVEIIIPVQVEKSPLAQGRAGEEQRKEEQGAEGDAHHIGRESLGHHWGGAEVEAEPKEDQPVEREDKVEGEIREAEPEPEPASITALETAPQAEMDGGEVAVGEEGEEDPHKTTPAVEEVTPEVVEPAPEAQGSPAQDGVRVEEEKKHVETKWMHRDTKWMLRSTKWPSQQF